MAEQRVLWWLLRKEKIRLSEALGLRYRQEPGGLLDPERFARVLAGYRGFLLRPHGRKAKKLRLPPLSLPDNYRKINDGGVDRCAFSGGRRQEGVVAPSAELTYGPSTPRIKAA